MAELAQLLVNGLVTGSVIAVAAVGLSLVYGILRIVNFAHGDFLAFGAFMAFVVNATWGGNMVLAALFAMATTAALGLALELSLWRPMRQKGAGLINLFIISIGVALVLRHVLFLVWGAQPRSYDVNVFQVYDLGVVRLSLSQSIAIAVAVAAIVLIGLMLARTLLGKAMRALSDNRSLASVAGVDVDRITLYTWLLAGGLAGLGGVLQALVQNAFNPSMGFTLLLAIFAAVVLGGIGSGYGALAGGLAIGIAMEVSTWDVLAGGVNPVYKPVVAFVVLIAVLLLRPQGLLGTARAL